MKGYLVCNYCGKELEIKINEPTTEQALNNNWGSVLIITKDRKEGFFICDKCTKKLIKD